MNVTRFQNSNLALTIAVGSYLPRFIDGANQANSQKVHRRKGSTQATGDKGCQEVGSGDRRSKEASQVQARDGGSEGDKEVPEEHGATDSEAAVPATGS